MPRTRKEVRAAQDKFARLEKVAGRFKAWRPATDVLTRVEAVSTIFPDFDRATRVGGWPTGRFGLVHGPSHHGKAQPVDEPVLTPDGWRPIGSLRVGDCVIAADGTPTEVTGVYPQGAKDVYRVEMSDGASTRCCAEHLWQTATARELQRGRYVRGPRPERARIPTGQEGAGSVKSTADIAGTLDDVHYLPLVKPVQFERRDLPMDPYVLGLLLGDGGMSCRTVYFTSDDDELMKRVSDWALSVGDTANDATHGERCPAVRIVSPGRALSNTASMLDEMDLLGSRSESKRVPDEYLFSSIEQRIELLRGLLDTDGWVEPANGCAGFCSTSTALRDAVLFLVRSLGGRARSYLKETDHLDAWTVLIAFDNFCPFKLKRKAEQWPTRAKKVRRRIVKVERVGCAECVCISVASPERLYVTRDFIVTHNTIFVHGLGLSYLRAGHFYAYVDAEHTTPETWLRDLMAQHAENPAFLAQRPVTFEETVDAVRELVDGVAKARNDGDLEPDTSALIVIDSIRKLVPKNLLAKILKHGADGAKGSVDGAGGRAAQMRAALNAQWLDELTPLLSHTKTSLVFISRETEDPNADPSAKKYGTDFKVGGGKALVYDSSLVCRITRAAWVKESSADNARIIGEKHRVRIHKTKVGGKEGRYTDAFFHTSNGVLQPPGFDPARDLLEMALERGDVVQSGSWYSTAADGESIGQGKNAAVKYLYDNPDTMNALQERIAGDAGDDE